jgi:hypothetical protein
MQEVQIGYYEISLLYNSLRYFLMFYHVMIKTNKDRVDEQKYGDLQTTKPSDLTQPIVARLKDFFSHITTRDVELVEF